MGSDRSFVPGASAETWRGLTVPPESRCPPYGKDRDYPDPQSVERGLVRELGAVATPYRARPIKLAQYQPAMSCERLKYPTDQKVTCPSG